MDWIRRNWPDLLIGIALVAVIAGIIATLLTGGSFFPLGASQASSSRPEQSSTTDFDLAGPTTVVDTRPTVEEGHEEGQGPKTTPVAREDDEESVAVSALPLPGAQEEEEPVTVAETEQVVEQPATRQPSAGAAELAETELPGTYRISVGAFSGEDNAERQAETFRDAGYPVFIGTQGDLSIVLVGPYDQLAEAEQIAERIREGGFRIEPVIYLFQGDSEADSGAVASGQPSSAPTPAPTAAQATAGQFLQVGAYGTRESSLPQRARLEGLGFRVSERVESGLVKLLVGPFAGDELTEARVLLNEQGIDHFPR